jgi:hypothetical protein
MGLLTFFEPCRKSIGGGDERSTGHRSDYQRALQARAEAPGGAGQGTRGERLRPLDASALSLHITSPDRVTLTGSPAERGRRHRLSCSACDVRARFLAFDPVRS